MIKYDIVDDVGGGGGCVADWVLNSRVNFINLDFGYNHIYIYILFSLYACISTHLAINMNIQTTYIQNRYI